ncbi:MAG: L-rhamnose mutarotase [Phycisphaeraceae bacterium]|nr:L-rhamnose mutarotase [Phycisphaeraceae bacterium]
MRAFAQALDLVDDPELIEEYRRHHRRVWPEVVSGLRAIGIRNMRIFLAGSRLFMYYEAPDDFDPSRDYQFYANDPRTREWDELMRRYQRPVPGCPSGRWWMPMEEVFDLESANGSGSAG